MATETVADLAAKLGLNVDTRSFAAGDRLIGLAKKGLVAIAGLGAVKWAAGMIKETVDAADKLDELAQQTGVNVESLQALSYAAGFSGIGVDELAQSLGFFAKNADAAARGSKSQARAFKALGVDAKGLIDGSVTLEDALGTMAEKFKSMPDGPAKTALSMAALGKSGKKMIPFLNEGKAGIAKLTAEARRLGVVIDGPTIKAMSKFNDSQDRIKQTMKGLVIQAVGKMLPTLTRMAERLEVWIEANRELIATGLEKALDVVVVAADAVGTAIGVVVDVFEFLADHAGIVKVALIGLGAAFLILRARSIAAALASGVAWVASMLPLILIGALITALILFVDDLKTAIEGGDSVLADLYESAKKYLSWDKLWAGIKIGLAAVLSGLGAVGAEIADKLGLETKFLIGEGGQAGVDQWTSDFVGEANMRARRAKVGGEAGINQSFVDAAGFGGVGVARAATGGGRAGAATVNIQGGPITVNGANASPEQIAAEIDRKNREFYADQARILSAAMAGGQ